MKTTTEITRISKFLSLVLRHQPSTIGLALDANGWAIIGELLAKSNAAGIAIDLELLQHIVATNSKKRFAFDESMTKIRASQGHSIAIDLELRPTAPPEILYHGTAAANVQSIMTNGISKQSRTHVHLSTDQEIARTVGARHGKPFVFEVRAGEMSAAGYQFFLSENMVWLTEYVPTEFLPISADL
ncbi:RNA 2'-phosphotransferase [Flavihumibacter petaseus]|uniref:Probable RNA 2'-phosphotransferase n=1 Tax=Flavihumibacter petaseus NBRC 106054 TaxID=1220578 RepID=A0A0E9N1E5_9BACT|nr:RNA 2'-phosphotransferase [Flavihumibacter petaseus]GAO43588.1 putative RNA 2'-phosphotransferase [Flavihumibacter petaseus NBRC 106054]